MEKIQQVEPDRAKGGNPFVNGVSHYRASSAAKPCEDQGNLFTWNGRFHALLVAENPALAAALRATDDKREQDALLRQYKPPGAADHGTTLHADLEESLSNGTLPREKETLAAIELMDAHGIEPLLSEVFVRCLEAPWAGTTDLVVRHQGRVRIADLKTHGEKPYDVARYSGASWAAQTAVYSRSIPWCRDEGDLDWPFDDEIDREVGLILDITTGTCEARLVEVDLTFGWEIAQQSLAVLDLRKRWSQAARPAGGGAGAPSRHP
jgi:hypothetical protein